MEFEIDEAARIAGTMRTYLKPDEVALGRATDVLIRDVIAAARAANLQTSEPHEESPFIQIPGRPSRVVTIRRNGDIFAPLKLLGVKDAEECPRLEFNAIAKRWEGLDPDTYFCQQPGTPIRRRAAAAVIMQAIFQVLTHDVRAERNAA